MTGPSHSRPSHVTIDCQEVVAGLPGMGPISKGSQLILTSPSLETLVLAKEVDFASKASPCEL